MAAGLIYRIASNGDSFVLYSAPKKEITALAIDKQGNIFAAGVGEKRPGASPAIPSVSIPSVMPSATQPSGQPNIVITPPGPDRSLPRVHEFPMAGAGASGGSEDLPDRSRRIACPGMGIA